MSTRIDVHHHVLPPQYVDTTLAGGEPLVTVQLYTPLPPVALTVWL